MPRAMTGRAREVPRRYTFCVGMIRQSAMGGMDENPNLVNAVGLDGRVDQLGDEFAFHVLSCI